MCLSEVVCSTSRQQLLQRSPFMTADVPCTGPHADPARYTPPKLWPAELANPYFGNRLSAATDASPMRAKCSPSRILSREGHLSASFEILWSAWLRSSEEASGCKHGVSCCLHESRDYGSDPKVAPKVGFSIWSMYTRQVRPLFAYIPLKDPWSDCGVGRSPLHEGIVKTLGWASDTHPCRLQHPELGCDVNSGVKPLSERRIFAQLARSPKTVFHDVKPIRMMMRNYLAAVESGNPYVENCNYLPQAVGRREKKQRDIELQVVLQTGLVWWFQMYLKTRKKAIA